MTRGPVYEGKLKVYWTTAIANIAGPKVAEFIAGGTYMGRLLTKDGVALGVSQNKVDVASIDELFDAQRMGSWGADVELTLFRDDTTETEGWTIAVNGTKGFIVIAPFGTPTTGKNVYVLPVEMGVPRPADSASNSPQTFKLSMAVTSEPNFKAIVAAP